MTIYREIGGVDRIIIIGPGITPGMVQVGKVGKVGEDWQNRPESRWQIWPEDLEPCEELRKAA